MALTAPIYNNFKGGVLQNMFNWSVHFFYPRGTKVVPKHTNKNKISTLKKILIAKTPKPNFSSPKLSAANFQKPNFSEAFSKTHN